MKKIMISALLGLTSFAYANVNTMVSILPQKTFVKAIGGDKVNVSVMVLPGKSPHTYEPKPSQMKAIAKADLYFAIDVEFEDVWLPKFVNLNKKMKVIDLASGIEKIAMKEHTHHEDEEKHEEHKDEHDGHEDEHDEHKDEHKDGHEEHAEEGLDPHIWASTSNVKIIAKNILTALISEDAQNKDYYTQNYNKFIEHASKTDTEIKKILLNTQTGTKFMVFHPNWGYFAKDYGLTQFAIEAGGKNPKPKKIAYLIEEAKEEKVSVIFTAPEFSDKVARLIAKEVGIKVLKISALNPKWSQNLINLAKGIANK